MRFSHLILVCAFASCAHATDYFVTTAGNFQAALNAALPGDTITLQAGTTYAGNFVLPNKTSGTGWITIRSSARASLPPDGVRVTPAYAQYMPKIVDTLNMGAISAAPGAHHYILTGLELTVAPGLYSYRILELGYGNETQVSDLPHDIDVNQVYIHGDPAAGSKRGITLNSVSTTIRNSYISDIKSLSQDSQSIMGWNGPGPYHILNNYLEASGENIMFGGATPTIQNMVPSDIEFRDNYCFKPLSWKFGDPSFAGSRWWIKNLFELKNAQRVLVDGNVFENSWADQQSGVAIMFTVRAESGTAPWAVVHDVTFTHNIVRHAGIGFDVTGSDAGLGEGARFRIENNIVDDINPSKWGGNGFAYLVLDGTKNLTINHNTSFQTGSLVNFDGVPDPAFVFTNNIGPHNDYGIFGSFYGMGIAGLAYYAPDGIVTSNVIAGGNSGRYPAGNFFPATLNDVGFTNLSGGDYRLLATSPFHNAGTDGADLGANVPAVLAATANAVSGAGLGTAPPVITVSVSPSGQTITAGQTQQFNASVSGTANQQAIWSITPQLGSISANGLYTAPSTVASSQSIAITATSVVDTTKSASVSLTVNPAAASSGTFTPIRINAGGPAYTDPSGNLWSADTGYTSGGTYFNGSSVANTATQPLYQSERWNSGTVQYQFTVPNGSYNVNLKFAEIYFASAGQRIFNIVINGKTVQSNFDPLAQAGAAYKAIDRLFPVTVAGGQITIQLVPVVSNPKISAIEILAAAPVVPVVPVIPVVPAGFQPIRINAGGPAYTDPSGNLWSADTGYTGGGTYSNSSAIANTTTQPLYQTERWNSGTVQYQFTVPNGSYNVNLKFAEIYFASAGQRTFNIVINGQTVQSNFDPLAQAGAAYKAIDRLFPLTVTGGQITIQLVPVVSNPKISAIEILAAAPVIPVVATAFQPIRINAGGSAYTDTSGNLWSADTGYTGGGTYSNSSAIANTTTQPLYQTERWDSATVQYQFAVPNGSYNVNLKFAEIYFTSAGQRIFTIVINGQTVQSNFDPLAQAGAANKAIDKLFPVVVTGGQITIQLVPVVSNPKISAIEIY